MQRLIHHGLACALLGLALPAFAQSSRDGVVVLDSPQASDQRLDRLRGGADVGAALHISFGLERLTTVNGALVASTQFQVQDIAHVTPAEALAARQALGTLLTVNDGHVSTTVLPAGNQSVATVIQNSLPGQAIKNIVTVDMTANSLALLRAANAADQLRTLPLPGH